MAASTTYDVRLRYMLEDRATRGMTNLAAQTERASRASGLLQSGFARITALGAGVFGIHKLKQAFVGFNSDMEQAKTTMAGMIQLNLGGEWSKNMKQANTLVEHFQDIAKRSVGTTKDFVSMASLITRPITAAGMSMQDLEDITAGATVAARAFGIQAEVAALDIEQVLMGSMGKKDRFARALLEPVFKMSNMTIAEFNKLDAISRATMLKQALTSKTIKDMAKAQESTFAGVYSTFQDNLERFLGSVGLPLFKAITAELQKWNAWLDSNQQTVQRWSQQFGKALVTGFKAVGKVIGFFIDHKDALLLIAKTWATVKIGQKLGGMVAAAGGAVGAGVRKLGGFAMMTDATTKAGLGIAKFGLSITNVTSKLAAFGPAIGLGIMAIRGLYKWFRSADEKKKEEERKNIRKAQELRGKVSFPEMKSLATTVTSSMDELERLRKEREGGIFALGAAPGSKESLEAYKKDYQEEYLREVQLQEALGEKATDIGAMYKQVAEYAQREGLAASHLGEWTQSRIEKAALNIAVKEGVSQQEFAIGALQQALTNLDYVLNKSTDATGDFAKMLKGEYLPGVLNSPNAFDKTTQENLEPGKGKGKTKVNVTIQRIEVQTDDPDRFVFGLSEAFSDAAKNPSSIIDSFREG